MQKNGIVHLMYDDKFLDYFIQLSEEVFPEKSTYLVKVSDKGRALKYIKSPLVVPILWNKNQLPLNVEKLKGFEKIVLHSFDPITYYLLKKIDKTQEVIWIFWGFEGYRLAELRKGIFLQKTDEIIVKLRKGKRNFIGLLKARINRNIKKAKESFLTKGIIDRIDVCATCVIGDYYLIKNIQPKLRYKYFSYYSIEQLGLKNYTTQNLDITKIWVGNSANPANNHADALYRLKEMEWAGEIYVPLSYGGSNAYIQEIIILGVALFGDRFKPITEFLPLAEYQALLSACGVVWMNHVRQQAAGNCFAALYMGKVLVLNPENTMFSMLVNWRLLVYTPTVFSNLSEIEASQLLRINQAILGTMLTHEYALVEIAKLYE